MRAPKLHAGIFPAQVETYLRTHGHPMAELVGLRPLGDDLQEGLKGHGYGRPLRARFVEDGEAHDLVIRTVRPDAFGHDRRADRMDGLLQAYDTFPLLPRHIRPIDIGVVTAQGELRSISDGEPFLITNYVDGDLYAHDLSELARLSVARPLDLERATALADYLANLHQTREAPAKYRRAIRDLIGHGEGIFGLTDAYLATDAVAPPARLIALEKRAIEWRWSLKSRADRARRTHGDFHPFNILFRSSTDFSVLDASRGAAGDPADDVTALSINFLFFALAEQGRFDGGLREVWDVFWERYLRQTQDLELLGVVAPFFAWRSLVVACPAWYPDLTGETRETLLSFAERLLDGVDFNPTHVDELLR